ncbi:MAG: chromate transporter [Oligoflexia bacterium]|nr:MAG: chromate transporter [Oligoflexia bacterium]
MKKAIECIGYFLRLGLTGFGGPLAVIAQMQRDLVVEKKWISAEEFRQTLSLIKSMPGPVSFQMILYVARKHSGTFVALLSGIVFILPAFLMMILLAEFYADYKQNVSLSTFLEGMQAGAFILILVALRDIARPYYSRSRFWAFLILSILFIGFAQVHEAIVIIVMGLIAVMYRRLGQATLRSFIPMDLILVCLKAGALAFGTGLTIVPLLHSDFVSLHHWITHEEFMDALAFGQITPGPVMVTVTFLGYKLWGWVGAIITTICVFLPSAVHMLTWFPHAVGWMNRQKWVQDFVLGATAALAAGIILVLISIGQGFTLALVVIPLCLLGLMTKFKWPSWTLIVGTGLIHLMLTYLH